MSKPLLVRSYDNGRASPSSATPRRQGTQTLPPIASFTFAEILRSADSAEFQSAIDGIAEICAKNRMSLADEYSSHLPPQGEITAASSAAARPLISRPGMRRPLTSVPEASSSGSEDSRRSKKRRGSLFFFRPQRPEYIRPSGRMRIGSMGRTASVSSTAAISTEYPNDIASLPETGSSRALRGQSTSRIHSGDAASSLQQILDRRTLAD